MEVLLRPLDRVFNKFFTSKYNPLYRSGAIAVCLLLIAIVTGFYLLFFYKLREPYESVVALSDNRWLGGLVQSLHRYASDLFVVAVFFHVLRVFAQKKAYGPRAFTWISGVFLVFLALVSGWTGFVMVWDKQGQALAISGAKIFDSLSIFPDLIRQSFAGVEPPQASFFFLNLFIHIVVPLAMVLALWVHTMKIARPKWFPDRLTIYGILLSLTVVAIAMPVDLGEKADLFSTAESFPMDWYYNFWLPLMGLGASNVFFIFAAFFIFLISVPFLFKGRHSLKTSFNDPEVCQSCGQCAKDCPYEAIDMVAMVVGGKQRSIAQVKSEKCVGCGLCAASCGPFTMGMEGQKGGDQLAAAKSFLSRFAAGENSKSLVVSCQKQSGFNSRLKVLSKTNGNLEFYHADCVGTLNPFVIGTLASKFAKLAIVSCPEANCTNRDGVSLLNKRLNGEQEPFFKPGKAKDRVFVLSAGVGEEKRILKRLISLKDGVTDDSKESFWSKLLYLAGASVFVLFFVMVGNANWGTPSDSGLLRISIRLVGQAEKTCADVDKEALKSQPAHMRRVELCETRPVTYSQTLYVDEKIVFSGDVSPGGFKKDRPHYVFEEFRLTPGIKNIRYSLLPKDKVSSNLVSIDQTFNVEIKKNRVALIHYLPSESTLALKENE